MTTERQMVVMYAAQQKVIALLNETGDADLAARLERCLDGTTRAPLWRRLAYSCRSAACVGVVRL
jgi:hypothetical protein